jgi:hypothetical protein
VPIHFDRFRLLNEETRFRNESQKVVFIYGGVEPDPIPVRPGEEVELPTGEEILLEVENEIP